MPDFHLPTHEAPFLNLPKAAEYLGISALNGWVVEQEKADSRSNPSLNPLNQKPQRRVRRGSK